MARNEACSHLVKKRENALMPASPMENPKSSSEEGLSQNGETGSGRKQIDDVKDDDKKEESEEEDEEEGTEEGRKSVGRNSPKEPTKVEREEHARTHCPYRSWCAHCVKSRARNAPHRGVLPPEPLEEVKVPRVHMDYFFMSREDEEASNNPLLVVADERTGSRYARAVGVKGLGQDNSMDWLVEDLSHTLKSWGHAGGKGGEVIVKTDGEPALLAVRNALMRYHGGIMIPECPAKGEKAENGLIEEAGKTVREFVCTFISAIEYGIDDTLPLDATIIPWIVRWAAICYSRYKVGKDGRTAYERLRGRTCRSVVVPFGEKVWYKQLGDGGDRRNKAETEWFPGVWLVQTPGAPRPS